MEARSEEGACGPSVRTDKPPEEAVDLARALFAAGATPGEVRATVAEVFSPPRATAAASRNPGIGVLPA
eukprot:4642913-Alexandrium_andersonii.AAC.1